MVHQTDPVRLQRDALADEIVKKMERLGKGEAICNSHPQQKGDGGIACAIPPSFVVARGPTTYSGQFCNFLPRVNGCAP